MQPLRRWQNKGMIIGSLNIRGLTFLKLLLLMEMEDLDVLCLYETWMAAGATVPAIPGYNVVE
jgi:hypothetical protein